MAAQARWLRQMTTMPSEADGTEAEALWTSPTVTATTTRRSRRHSEPLTLTMEQGNIRQRQDDGLQWTRSRRNTTAPRRTPSATTIR